MTLVKRKNREPKPTVPGDASETGTPANEDEIEDFILRNFPYLFERFHQPKAKKLVTSKRFLIPLTAILTLVLVVLFIPMDIWELLEQAGIPRLPEVELARLFTELGAMRSAIPSMEQFQGVESFLVGSELAGQGYTAEYPVIIIPGIISTGLESWSTMPEHRPYFRQKIWGGMSMIGHVLSNREKWMAALMLDPDTGLDPVNGAKLRAAQGVDAASSFIQGYWIWAKIVENLAVLNYDTNNLFLAAYDWRLSYYNLGRDIQLDPCRVSHLSEVRDGYFTRLKSRIEMFKKLEGKKSVLVSHSMGGTVRALAQLYLKWAEAEGHGNGGPNWVEDHIESWITIAGTHLAKAMTAFLSGEMRDTVEINPAGAYVLDRFFSKRDRQKLFRSWAGSASMWIKGGSSIWGNVTHAPDDPHGCDGHTHGQFVSFRKDPDIAGALPADPDTRNMTAEDVSAWILEHTPTSYQKMVGGNYSYGIERDEAKLKKNDNDHRKWTNPLEVRLPNAPNMKLFCVYGHGKETERSYWYARGAMADAPSATCAPDLECTSERAPLDIPLSRSSFIDTGVHDDAPEIPIKVRSGVKFGEGDGTVSLISLGAMCADGWRRPRWNPAGIKVTTYELQHNPNYNIRGGAQTGDHVDVLGSNMLNEVILKVVSGHGHEIKERFVSKIREYTKRIRWDA
ncbi:LACT-domain-containing protein [Auriculariales sp. MPI-PUGE-AT-0066]|nr:LACT-domain-containing protein [Auriculariales sp. MPI-PUGE-AT-0066]